MQNMQGFEIQWSTSEAVPTYLGRMQVRWNLGFWTLARSGYALAAHRSDTTIKIFFLSLRSPLTRNCDGSWTLSRDGRFAPLDNLLEHAPTLRIDRV